MKNNLSIERIRDSIYWIRGQRVMADRDLALLYGVETKALLQAVKRNRERFPKDFMFQLEWNEAKFLRSQFVTLKNTRGLNFSSRSQIVTLKKGSNLKYRPYAFTEQGIAMLSSVLRSRQAVSVNIAIMRIFVKLRGLFASHRNLANKLNEFEKKLSEHDHEIQNIFSAIRALMLLPEKPKRKIGFRKD